MLLVQWLRRLSLFCAEISGWLVVPMMASIFLDALLRSLFNVALIGIVESNSLLLVALVYLGIAGAQARGANFRLTLLTERVSPWLKGAFTSVGLIIVIVVFALLSWFTWQSALFSIERDESSYGLVNFPLWPSRLLVALGMSLLWLQIIVDSLVFWLGGSDPFTRDTAGSSSPTGSSVKDHP